MKRIALIILLLALLPCACFAAGEFSVDAKAAVLIDAASGRVLYQQNANEPLPMASTTKLMTCLLALENSALSDMVTASANASGVPGTSIYLSVGESLTMEQMLYGLMLRSGNDAAVAIAEHVAGGVPEFAEMMNARAAELSADASFINPHGLDAKAHAASAMALAKIMRECMKHPDFRVITATRKKIIPWVGNEFSRVLENKNKLLSTYEGANGGKTGFTSDAGRCLVFSAKRSELEIIGVVLNCPNWFNEAAKLLDYGFSEYECVTPLSAMQLACEISVANGEAKSVKALAATDLRCAIREGESHTVYYDFGSGVTAPVERGEVIGRAYLRAGSDVLAECELIAADAVHARTLWRALKRIIGNWLN